MWCWWVCVSENWVFGINVSNSTGIQLLGKILIKSCCLWVIEPGRIHHWPTATEEWLVVWESYGRQNSCLEIKASRKMLEPADWFQICFVTNVHQHIHEEWMTEMSYRYCSSHSLQVIIQKVSVCSKTAGLRSRSVGVHTKCEAHHTAFFTGFGGLENSEILELH